ncbi:hypothetical protein [Jeotgalibacillus proteolyticus]|uniref:Uncharacterized protein n=1 Tax=Jeotgalibacillus proteolyticus TaxID=2082395 RepID=A0A2S5GG80_9BACL|nr:hypothetical protein [Jeotgalibacillus proteolyticus]PPA71925.1 hypothetical protein C4B60_00675 [Jeotgalibacillus proteolyticus]
MIKEAMQYILSIGGTEIKKENGQTFSTQKLYQVAAPTVKAIGLNTLKGVVDYLKSEFDGKEDIILHVISPTEVEVLSGLNTDKERNVFIRSQALTPHIAFDRFHNAEEFNILIQSCFVKNEDSEIVLQVVGNIKEENVGTTGDDGISQTVSAKIGVATVSTVKVSNPVQLAPRRTFVDVLQPESDFVFRMQQGPRCALFEADGGRWKLEAMNNIRFYFEEHLDEEITAGRITVIS